MKKIYEENKILCIVVLLSLCLSAISMGSLFVYEFIKEDEISKFDNLLSDYNSNEINIEQIDDDTSNLQEQIDEYTGKFEKLVELNDEELGKKQEELNKQLTKNKSELKSLEKEQKELEKELEGLS